MGVHKGFADRIAKQIWDIKAKYGFGPVGTYKAKEWLDEAFPDGFDKENMQEVKEAIVRFNKKMGIS